MASYASTSDVNNIMGAHQVTADTKFTLTQLSAVLLNLDGFLNALLASIGFSVVPVVDSGGISASVMLAYLKTVESWGGAAIAYKALFPEAMGPGSSPAYQYWEDKWNDAIKGIRERKDIPTSLFGTQYQASSYFTQHPDAEAELGLLAGASLFHVDDLDQWPY